MKLLKQDQPDVEKHVLEGKCGYRFDAIVLDAEDFYRLSYLSPDQLYEWMQAWMCGFRPRGF